MSTLRATCALLILLTPVSAAAAAVHESAAVRSVLLISIDSLRADRLGTYGNPRNTSPTLDRLAAEGVRFERALSPTSWTLPAHATLLSGCSQRMHQVLTTMDQLPASLETLPEVFARHGYETVGFYSGPFLHPAYGFAQGFDAYVSCQSETTQRLEGSEAWEHAHADRTNALVEAAFAGWIERRSRRPFFVFVHMWDVHYDYIPPEPYASLYDGGYDGPLTGHNIAGDGFPLDATPADVAHLLALYDGELRYTDATLARMLARLDDAGLLDSTLVVVTADHGEEFLEHGGKGHQQTLYDEVLRVPLIFWARSGLPHQRVVRVPVSLADVAPTILELAGLPGLDAADGRSLVPAIRADVGESRPVFSALYHPTAARLRLVSVETGSTKLIHDPRAGTWSAFDLGTDPGEQRPSSVPEDQGLRKLLSEYASQERAALARRQGDRDRTASGAPPAEVIDRLRALGYVQ